MHLSFGIIPEQIFDPVFNFRDAWHLRLFFKNFRFWWVRVDQIDDSFIDEAQVFRK